MYNNNLKVSKHYEVLIHKLNLRAECTYSSLYTQCDLKQDTSQNEIKDSSWLSLKVSVKGMCLNFALCLHRSLDLQTAKVHVVMLCNTDSDVEFWAVAND